MGREEGGGGGGSGREYCANGGQSQWMPGVSAPIPGGGSQSMFNQMLKYRNYGRCASNGFYSYYAFIAAALSFSGFGTTRKRGSRRSWVRPPMKQLVRVASNCKYGQGADPINNPDLVAADPTMSFKIDAWFWMTPRGSKPSFHNVIIGRWSPFTSNRSAGRVPGYSFITNIINGGLKCGDGQNDKVANRIGFYKRYCDIFGVGYGNNLDCCNQRHLA
ncbi:basic chitinase [Actinidia rufa]|uniref:chitinase n=1 Tax=Actinidia rufa TaxID=165716 RepID=A0A7J0GFD7_9ERIC|nr:basic chitinase [Actinidia rufa]